MVNEFMSGGRYAAGRLKKDWKFGSAKILAIFLVAAVFVLFNVLELKPSYQSNRISQHPDFLPVDGGNDSENNRTAIELVDITDDQSPIQSPVGGDLAPKRSPYPQMIETPSPAVLPTGGGAEKSELGDDASTCFTCSSCPVVGPRKKKKKRDRVVEILSISDMADRLGRSRTAVSNSTVSVIF